jgi:hypothetical protein
MKNFQLWKSVSLKACSFEGSLALLGKTQLFYWAKDALSRIEFAHCGEKLDLVRVSVGDMGFSHGVYRKDIYRRAFELGLRLCPQETVVSLRVEYLDQPVNENLMIASEPVMGSGSYDLLFNLSDYGHLAVACQNGMPNGFWLPKDEWVFQI